MAEKKLKVLTLSIKQKFFDEILAGTKTHEYRVAHPSNAKKYYYLEADGKIYTPYVDDDQIPDNDAPIHVEPIKYDAIKLLTGAYSGKRPWALVEVKDVEIVKLVDQNGDDIVLEWKDGTSYLALQIDYTLGKVLDKDLNPQ